MTKRIFIAVGACFYLAALCWAWELTPSLSYGVVFLDGAPNAYKETEPEAMTNEPVCAAVEADFGRFGLAASYAPRYEMYGEVGKVHDVEVVGRAAPFYGESWAVYGEAGLAVSRSAAPMAFLFEEGPEYNWTAVAGAGLEYGPREWLDINAGVTYRERLQVINFFIYDPCYGTVKSPAVDISADCLFEFFKFAVFGASFRQIFYGPYDYYLYSQTNRNKGWITAKETYVLATVAFPVSF
jgi:hypothetical protein